MEEKISKVPFRVKTKCVNCKKEVKMDLQNMPASGESAFKYECPHCKQMISLLDDKDFIDFAKEFIEHKDEFREWVLESLALGGIEIFDRSDNPLNLDEKIISLLKKIPKEKLRKMFLGLFRNKKVFFIAK